MKSSDTLQKYLQATNELLLEFAREAKNKSDESRSTPAGDFNAGYLMGFNRVISLMLQQAMAYGIEDSVLGMENVDPDRDFS